MYKLIVSDVDGCISPEESAGWDLGAFMELARTIRGADGAAPLPLTLCTGRPQPYVEALMKLLNIRLPAICENGAVLYSLHDNRSHYGPGVTEHKLAELREIRRFIVGELLHRHSGAVYQFGKEAQLSLYSGDPSRIPVLADEIQGFAERYEDNPVEISASHYYLNISLRGVTKGSALRHLMEQLDVSHADVAAVGDTVGDLPLREEAAFFAAPANATSETKARADYVSPYENVKGVLDILRRIAT